MALRLQLRGYEVLEAANGEEALQLAHADGRIGILVLDLKMPGMSGEQLLRHVRQMRPELPVIVLTGMGEAGAPPGLIEAGAFAILEKPGDLDDLIRAVEAAHPAGRERGGEQGIAGIPGNSHEQERGE
jgi:DNA-binding NtrC family response regulator